MFSDWRAFLLVLLNYREELFWSKCTQICVYSCYFFILQVTLNFRQDIFYGQNVHNLVFIFITFFILRVTLNYRHESLRQTVQWNWRCSCRGFTPLMLYLLLLSFRNGSLFAERNNYKRGFFFQKYTFDVTSGVIVELSIEIPFAKNVQRVIFCKYFFFILTFPNLIESSLYINNLNLI